MDYIYPLFHDSDAKTIFKPALDQFLNQTTAKANVFACVYAVLNISLAKVAAETHRLLFLPNSFQRRY